MRTSKIVSDDLADQIRQRKTSRHHFAPRCGQDTLTEKLLLFGGAIQMAGTVKGRKPPGMRPRTDCAWTAARNFRDLLGHAVSLRESIVNLLDTPGSKDFSEDT